MALTDKRIIVTGASGGMGLEIVRHLVAGGARVAAVDLKEQPGREAVEALNGTAPGSASFWTADLTDKAEVTATINAASASLGGLDALVHAAGVVRVASPEESTESIYDLIMDVNVRATVYANQAVFEALKANGGGSIVNFGSNAGHGPEPNAVIYSASKGAVHSWSRSLAHAWGRYNIRVNAVLPIIETPMFHQARAEMTEQQRADHDERNRRLIPLGGKFGDAARDLAPVIEFLVDEASHFMTGQLIPVDGGLSSVR